MELLYEVSIWKNYVSAISRSCWWYRFCFHLHKMLMSLSSPSWGPVVSLGGGVGPSKALQCLESTQRDGLGEAKHPEPVQLRDTDERRWEGSTGDMGTLFRWVLSLWRRDPRHQRLNHCTCCSCWQLLGRDWPIVLPRKNPLPPRTRPTWIWSASLWVVASGITLSWHKVTNTSFSGTVHRGIPDKMQCTEHAQLGLLIPSTSGSEGRRMGHSNTARPASSLLT